jgi:3-isopropylmalate/(R)-2-methylmalate dehydratase small subunit
MLSVDFDTGMITHQQTGNTYKTKPIPVFMQELIQSGGLMNHIRKKIQNNQA